MGRLEQSVAGVRLISARLGLYGRYRPTHLRAFGAGVGHEGGAPYPDQTPHRAVSPLYGDLDRVRRRTAYVVR